MEIHRGSGIVRDGVWIWISRRQDIWNLHLWNVSRGNKEYQNPESIWQYLTSLKNENDLGIITNLFVTRIFYSQQTKHDKVDWLVLSFGEFFTNKWNTDRKCWLITFYNICVRDRIWTCCVEHKRQDWALVQDRTQDWLCLIIQLENCATHSVLGVHRH